MPAPATYDPAQIKVIVGGAPIKGFADGEFVNAEQESDDWVKTTGSDGLTVRGKQNDYSGLITLTLLQASPSNNILSGFYILDRTTNTGIVPVQIKDLLGTTVLASAYGWIRKPPPVTYAKDIGVRVWNIDCAELDIIVGGNFQFTV